MEPVPRAQSLTKPTLVVIGAGVMGRNYLRAARTAGLKIDAVVDVDAIHARSAAEEFGCRIAAGAGAFDAAIIAAPTAAHAATAWPLLQAGVHCLVEKPFAASEAECRRLMDAAAASGAVLQIGHIERFNPAVEALIERGVAPSEITAITGRRMGPASARVTDLSVIADLMVHDLDVVLALKPMSVTKLEATGNRDHGEVTLTFSDGASASLTASRTSPIRVRDLHVKAGDAGFHLDYIAKSLVRLPNDAGDKSTPAEVFTGDALGAQLAHFISCIREGRTPRVDGKRALEVMRLAWRIEAALGLTS